MVTSLGEPQESITQREDTRPQKRGFQVGRQRRAPCLLVKGVELSNTYGFKQGTEVDGHEKDKLTGVCVSLNTERSKYRVRV